jgi:hypothetical protein
MTPSAIFDWLILQPRVCNGSSKNKVKPIPKRHRSKGGIKQYYITKHRKGRKRLPVRLRPKTKASANQYDHAKETKIILLNGKAIYRTSCRKSGISSMHSEDELFAFAEKAVASLKERTMDAFLYEGISRIDCFSVNGQLYVNEVENLDAEYPSNAMNESCTRTFLCGYYKTILSQIINGLSQN